ncbi:hypothetical protein [Granulicella arctica]|uniref:hypothetical protein n=1 Tax=Granulicella arctica TaxID=940613 RepID=UPI0021DF7C79|nr:hypothetical protein [Granulicella arctica]
MAFRLTRWALITTSLVVFTVSATAQVFVVGEKTATADIATDFTPTHLSLPSDRLTERGRRDLVRNLEAEQGFAHRALPMGAGITLQANGKLLPGAAEYKQMIYRKGESSAPGDRIVITAVTFKPGRIVLDLNGGPYAKHRFLSHISLNDAPIAQTNREEVTGSRVTLEFEGGVPEISAPEVKALLEPVLDFGVKNSEEAYADTLAAPLKEAVAAHDVLVGMNHRMVLAALGAPESKVREHDSTNPDGPLYEEWIYGHVPQTVKFVRFQGDRVAVVKIVAMGKAIEVHDTNEMGDFLPPPPTREIAMGDVKPNAADGRGPAPSLRQPGDPEAAPNTVGKVQFPTQKKSPAPTPVPAVDGSTNGPTP